MKFFVARITTLTMVLLLIASVVLPQTTGTASPRTQTDPMSNMPMTQGNHSSGMMKSCPAMVGGMCPMMMDGGGMGGPWMTVSMILRSALALATIFALFSAGLFLLRRSRSTVGPAGGAQ